MRHFYASVLINEGVDAAAVSGALGNSVIGTMSSIYCHVFQRAQARAGDAIASVLDFSGKKKASAKTVMNKFSRIMGKRWTDGNFRVKESLVIGFVKPITRRKVWCE